MHLIYMPYSSLEYSVILLPLNQIAPFWLAKKKSPIVCEDFAISPYYCGLLRVHILGRISELCIKKRPSDFNFNRRALAPQALVAFDDGVRQDQAIHGENVHKLDGVVQGNVKNFG